MGKVTGFLEHGRKDSKYRPAGGRVRHYNEFVIALNVPALRGLAMPLDLVRA